MHLYIKNKVNYGGGGGGGGGGTHQQNSNFRTLALRSLQLWLVVTSLVTWIGKVRNNNMKHLQIRGFQIWREVEVDNSVLLQHFSTSRNPGRGAVCTQLLPPCQNVLYPFVSCLFGVVAQLQKRRSLSVMVHLHLQFMRCELLRVLFA